MTRSEGKRRMGSPGHGVKRGCYVQHVTRFDDEMFARIRAKAMLDGTSLSEAVRTLVEWGLEAEECG